MTIQHTAGPWESDYDSTGELSLWDQHGNNLLVSESSLPMEERQANGKLAAAAPELLAALQSLLDHEGERELNAIGLELESQALEEAKESARSAIAKATNPS